MNGRADVEALRARAARLVESGRTEQAEAVLRDLLQRVPEDSFALAKLGVVHACRAELSTAERLLRRSIDLDPYAKSAHNNLGNVLLEQGRTEQAIECYRRAIKLDDRYARAYRNLAIAYKRLGEVDEYLHLLRQSYRAGGLLGRWAFWRRRGRTEAAE
jgi:tetratricopeptide (TPR) repeat protein